MSGGMKKAREKANFSERVSEWASLYDEPEPRTLGARNLLSRQRFALEMVETGVSGASKILDAGCGTGEMAEQLIRRGHEVWGLDISEPMIRYARERCGLSRFQLGDIEHLPFRDNTFDAVVCLGVLEYLDTDERVLSELLRVIKPGGRAVISTPNAICPLYHVDRALFGLTAAARPLYYFLKYRLRGRFAPAHKDSYEIVHRRFFRKRWLRRLRSVGLELEECVCHGWGWYSSWYLGLLGQFLSQQAGQFRHTLERFFGEALLCRAVDRLVRNRALNWLFSEQIVRVRAVK
jgi:ubiquinone/menaquinone biosynthesis C-methylase UbiE